MQKNLLIINEYQINMADKKAKEATPTLFVEDCLLLDSESFDPVHALYAQELPFPELVDSSVTNDKVIKFIEESASIHPETLIRVIEASTSSIPWETSKLIEEEVIPTENPDTELSISFTESFQITSETETKTEGTEKKCLKDTERQKLQTDPPKTEKNIKKTKKPKRNVLTEMVTNFQEGPLSILRRSVTEQIKVRVVTRNVRSIRGISTGYVVAFDKHMNLAMVDVDEIFRKPCGKHQKKLKNTLNENVSPVTAAKLETSHVGENRTAAAAAAEADIPVAEDRAAVNYPDMPWETVQASDKRVEAINETDSVPADGIGNLPSAFSAMHVFQDNEATRLLGTKCRRVLSRHLMQVLIRGDHVVAVALVN